MEYVQKIVNYYSDGSLQGDKDSYFLNHRSKVCSFSPKECSNRNIVRRNSQWTLEETEKQYFEQMFIVYKLGLRACNDPLWFASSLDDCETTVAPQKNHKSKLLLMKFAGWWLTLESIFISCR